MRKRIIPKRLLNLLLAVVLIITVLPLVAFTTNVSASSECNISAEDDIIIKDIIIDFAKAEDVHIREITYQAENVYLFNEQWMGYIIDFDSDVKSGYAIIFKLDNELHLIEMYFGRRSPFYGKQGMFIYPSLGYYFIKIGDEIEQVN